MRPTDDVAKRQLLRAGLPLLAGAGVVALVATSLMLRPGPVPTGQRTEASAAVPAALRFAQSMPLPADCRPTPNPPPTEYGFVAKITQGGVKGGRMEISGLTAQMCGIVRIVAGKDPGCKAQGELIIPSDGIIFPSDLKTTLNVVPGMSPQVPTEVRARPVTKVIDCNDSSANGLKLELAITVDGKAGAFGLECAIPFTGTAHTVITGDLLSGDYTGDFTMTGDDFRAEKVANNDKYCPGHLPGHVNAIAALPGSGYHADLSGQVAIYQP